MSIVVFILVAILAYFIGAIPFGLIYARIRGVDIRKTGSGNIGATNVARQFGFMGGFVPIFLLDMMKGALPVLAVFLAGVNGFDKDIAMLITGVLAILGHTFPIYLKFKGGKGVATTAGVFLVIAPIPFLVAFAIFLLLYATTKVVAIGSITAAFCLPFAVYFLAPGRTIVFIVSIVLAALLIFLHRSNIARLINGEKKK